MSEQLSSAKASCTCKQVSGGLPSGVRLPHHPLSCSLPLQSSIGGWGWGVEDQIHGSFHSTSVGFTFFSSFRDIHLQEKLKSLAIIKGSQKQNDSLSRVSVSFCLSHTQKICPLRKRERKNNDKGE